MIKENLIENISEVKENGYVKIDKFIDTDSCKDVEKQVKKAFKKAKKNYFHTKTNYVKVLSVKNEDSKNVKYFNFLNYFFDNENIHGFIKEYFDSEDVEISKYF